MFCKNYDSTKWNCKDCDGIGHINGSLGEHICDNYEENYTTTELSQEILDMICAYVNGEYDSYDDLVTDIELLCQMNLKGEK